MRTAAAVLMLVAVLAAGGCAWPCRPHYGFILRGDWSLELNRLPWIESCGSGADCAAAGSESIPAPAPEPLPELPADAGSAHVDASQAACASCARVRQLAWWLRCWRGGCGQTADAPGSAVAWGHSKFHPVPTRPVFWPRRPVALAAGPAQSQEFPSPTPAPPQAESSAPLPPSTTRTSSRSRVSATEQSAVTKLDEQARVCPTCPTRPAPKQWLFTHVPHRSGPAAAAVNAIAGV